MNCHVCKNKLQKSFSLGELYISNFIPKEHKSEDYPKSELSILVCSKCGLGRLEKTINPKILYNKYWYRSGINQTMHNALKNVVDSAMSSIRTDNGDIWLDIASNDGTLLSYVPDHFIKIGIDPSDIAKEDKKHIVVNDYFTKEVFDNVAVGKAKIVTCIAMFYDLENPNQFLNDVYDILDDDGLFIIQISYTPLMLTQLEFGNICAEHVMYYSLYNLAGLLAQHGLYTVDCELNDINGGSFRVYCVKNDKVYKNQQQRDIGMTRVDSLICHENAKNHVERYRTFYKTINQLGKSLNLFIRQAKKEGKTVYGYGASTKSNTLLQYFNINNKLIPKIAERNPDKHGLKTIGTEIPICSEEEMRDEHPNYLLILPWHFIEEFKEREKEYLEKGGKFIVPCPQFQIIEK